MANEPYNETLYRAAGQFVASGAMNPTSASRIPSSAASTNPTVAKASAGKLFSVNGFNDDAGSAPSYLKFYDKATAPTVGTDVPVLTLVLPAPNAEFSYDLGGFVFTNGIAYGLTTSAADNGSTAVGAGDILGLNVVYA